MIFAPWIKMFEQTYGSPMPDDYFCFDTETSGFDRNKDLILEWGHVLVRGRKPVNRVNLVINWFEHPSIPTYWLEERLLRVGRQMRESGKPWRLTADVLRREGSDPAEVIPWLHELLSGVKDQGLLFAGHNAWQFDVAMLQSHFKQDLDQVFEFPPNGLIDTGCIEKAAGMIDNVRTFPKPGDTMKDYFLRVAHWRAPGVFWNIDECIRKYNLVDKYGVDPTKSHTAGEDAFVVHLLMEEFRELIAKQDDFVLPAQADTEPEPPPSEPAKPQVKRATATKPASVSAVGYPVRQKNR